MSYDPPQQTWDQVTWRPGTAQANDFFVEQRGSVLTLTPSRGRHASAALVTTASLANVDACKKVTSYTKESIRLAVNATICLQVPGRSLSLLQVKDLSLQPPGAADRATTIDLLVTVRPLAG
jgi:hypothetical protein